MENYRQQEENKGAQLAVIAAALGIAAIVTTFIMPVIVPGVLGSLSIILAILSTGREPRMPRMSKIALGCGITSIVVYIAFIGVVITVIINMVTNPTVRAQANEIMEQMYGYSFDDLLDEIAQDYDADILYGTEGIENTPSQLILEDA